MAKVTNITTLKSGTSKTGKPYTLYKVNLEDGQEATGFEMVPVGEEVLLESSTYNGQTQMKYKPTGSGTFTSQRPEQPTPGVAPSNLEAKVDKILAGVVAIHKLVQDSASTPRAVSANSPEPVDDRDHSNGDPDEVSDEPIDLSDIPFS